MCICQSCSVLGLFIGELLYAAQKLVQCAAIGSVFTCLMFSFTIMLMLGVGLGYNHAYVEITGKKSRLRTDNETTGAIGTNNTNITESKEKQNILDDTVFGLPSDFEADEWRLKRNRISSSDANATTEDSPLSPTMVIPLRSKSNHLLIQILRKVEKQKKNITLEIVAT